MARRIRLIVSALTLCAGALAFAAPAHAGPIVDSATSCPDRSTSKPFRPWLDLADYVSVDNGGFESGADGWEISRGAVVDGNEPWKVRASGDSASLKLESGGTATTAPICVGIEHPTLRFFARGDGGLLSTLTVEVLFQPSFTSSVASLPIGVVVAPASAQWSPTLPLPVVANLLALLPGEKTAVAFRFRASGAWTIDDVYVDPYRKG